MGQAAPTPWEEAGSGVSPGERAVGGGVGRRVLYSQGAAPSAQGRGPGSKSVGGMGDAQKPAWPAGLWGTVPSRRALAVLLIPSTYRPQPLRAEEEEGGRAQTVKGSAEDQLERKGQKAKNKWQITG